MAKNSYQKMLKEIARDIHIPEKQIKTILNALYNTVAKSLKMGYRFVITGFGVFFVKNGEVCFKPSRRLVAILNN